MKHQKNRQSKMINQMKYDMQTEWYYYFIVGNLNLNLNLNLNVSVNVNVYDGVVEFN